MSKLQFSGLKPGKNPSPDHRAFITKVNPAAKQFAIVNGVCIGLRRPNPENQLLDISMRINAGDEVFVEREWRYGYYAAISRERPEGVACPLVAHLFATLHDIRIELAKRIVSDAALTQLHEAVEGRFADMSTIRFAKRAGDNMRLRVGKGVFCPDPLTIEHDGESGYNITVALQSVNLEDILDIVRAFEPTWKSVTEAA